jgi:hypothetical protein
MLHLNDVQKALVELLNDIRAMRVGDSSGALLIVVEDERAATVLRELLSFGSRAVLEANFVRWVGRRRRSHSSGGTVLSAKQAATSHALNPLESPDVGCGTRRVVSHLIAHSHGIISHPY